MAEHTYECATHSEDVRMRMRLKYSELATRGAKAGWGPQARSTVATAMRASRWQVPGTLAEEQ